MKNLVMICILATFGTLPVAAEATDINLLGKVTSTITAEVSAKQNFVVTSDTGGWFDQGLEMLQSGGWDTPYTVHARLKIVSTERDFQVRMDESLQIINASNAAQVFLHPKVELSAEGEAPKTLAVATATTFKNPVQNVTGEDSIGFYGLTISANPPTGTFKDVSGTYIGVLSLTFEPVISKFEG